MLTKEQKTNKGKRKENNAQKKKILRLLFSVALFPRTCTQGKVEIFLNSIQVLCKLTNTH